MTDQFGNPITPQDVFSAGEMPPDAAPKKSNTTMIILIVVLVVLCCCCVLISVAGWFFWTYGDQMLGISMQLFTPLLA